MIVVIGSPSEPMVRDVFEGLRVRAVLLPIDELPATIRIAATCNDGAFLLEDRRIEFADIAAVYQRVGFHPTELFEEFTPEQAAFAQRECNCLLNAILNSLRGRVVNRPSAAGSNASKPFQIGLIERHGWRVPRTLVTNQPSAAKAFYDAHHGQVIYKSVSYVRSIVQVMSDADLPRLDALRNCPIQLQERIEGFDLRVHVVGERVFASRMHTAASDYRYDRDLEVTPYPISDELAQRCIRLARHLNLELAGIDLRMMPDGEVCCFEVNPSPAFSWYEARTDQPITEAVCELLMNS
ncbi:MAG: ATP-grasp domain-containing protein [Candidatus Xenobia bacterium]